MPLQHSHTADAAAPAPIDRVQPCGRWMHVVPHLDPRFGGLSVVVPEIVSALTADGGCDAEIAAFCTAEETTSPLVANVRVTQWPLSRAAWVRDRSLMAAMRHHMTRVDGVHIHGLWEQSTFVAARLARALHKPYVLSAHGMLDPWALRNKRLKKMLYAAAVERRNVARAACLHALTDAEAEDYRRFLGTAPHPPIAVIPNGVTLPPDLSPAAFLERFPALRDRRLILFLGRIHYKKGVDVLVRAWARLSEAHPDAHLVIAGPDFEGTRARTESLIGQLGIGPRVTFTGMLGNEWKWSALAAASLFVLPSFSEGFSVSVLEAMGTGLPVIITPECHLRQVVETACGWITQSEVEPLASSLQEFLANPVEINREMGARGRRLVEQSFSWPGIARQTSEVYRSLEGGMRPAQNRARGPDTLHENR